MKNIPERTDSKNSYTSSTDSPDRICGSICSEAGPSNRRSPKASLWSGFLVSAFSVFDTHSDSRGCHKKETGFVSIGDSKYTSDVNWGCMLRSSQMLVAQALLIHRLGRSWRKPSHQPFDRDYIEILHMFGDSEDSAFSIHNLLQAGEGYALAPGSWVGPYAMCRTWETLARRKIEENEHQDQPFPMAVYVVSGDEDGERGGAPVLCIQDASRHCSEFSRGQLEWSPILLLVPLVLGLDKVNPRYLPLLAATFTFPQSLGILGGRPGASTYIIGVQDDKVFYLDPHEVQQAVNISKDNLEADSSSYHCNVIRQIPLESIDPSLAIGFYCRDKGTNAFSLLRYASEKSRKLILFWLSKSDENGMQFVCSPEDFDDFCSRASELAAESNGAPLFTVTETRHSSGSSRSQEGNSFDASGENAEGSAQDDWQLL
ncbi:Peptidase C54 [Cynara cardunculus var. scolymus]|uniref:Cysteine protease n=1 Tax=Cynara cardunculus var. scolymus TaxID=59895 RepID=A0A103YAB9_CYNCS|nr:Peptidase C54 [Cynara cardunculus var. scolymus]